VHVQVKGITVELDRDYYRKFCGELDIAFHHRTIEIDLNRDPG